MKPIYLDNSATTAVDLEVTDAMARCSRELTGNPSSQHQFGQRARRVLEEARERIAGMLGANTHDTHADRLIFTSGGTESNNLALRGMASQLPGKVIISAIEHPSVARTAEQLARAGFDVARLPADRDGLVKATALSELLDNETRLVSVMLANNETGVLQPVVELAECCRAAGSPMHTDAVQAVAKIPVDFQRLQVALLSISAHKFHGPAGIGALLVRHDVTLKPILNGGYQQQGLRAGTEPVVLAVGMSKALELWHREAERRENHMSRLQKRLESSLQSAVSGLQIHGSAAPRVPHTVSAAFPGVDRQALVMALDLAGVACSTGSACASGSSEPSPILLAMGIPPALVDCSIRLSLSAHTKTAEIDRAVERILHVYRDLQKRKETRKTPDSSRNQGPNRI